MLTKEEFASRLKTAMAEKKMKQVDLAEATGVTAANMSNYVRGKAFPPIDILVEIAGKLDVSLDVLCGAKNREQYFEPKTFGDVAQSIMCILNAIPLQCDIETISTKESQCMGMEYSGDYGEVPYYADVEVEIPVISFRIGEMRTFITDLMKMRKLLGEKTFDYKFYIRWLNDRIQALDKITLEPEPPFDELREAEDYLDGSLPF